MTQRFRGEPSAEAEWLSLYAHDFHTQEVDPMRTYESTRAHNKKPPSPSRLRAPWRIALVANLKDEFDWGPDAPSDAGSEFDRRETIESLAHLVRSVYRDLCENITGDHPRTALRIASAARDHARAASDEAPELDDRVHSISPRSRRTWDASRAPP